MTFGSVDRRSIQLSYGRKVGDWAPPAGDISLWGARGVASWGASGNATCSGARVRLDPAPARAGKPAVARLRNRSGVTG